MNIDNIGSSYQQKMILHKSIEFHKTQNFQDLII